MADSYNIPVKADRQNTTTLRTLAWFSDIGHFPIW